MKLYNPHSETVSVQIDGTRYSVDPGETVSVSDDVGAKWLKSHAFLTPSEEPVVAPAAPVKEALVEDAPEDESVAKARPVAKAVSRKVASK